VAVKPRLPRSALGDQLRVQFASNVRAPRMERRMTQQELADAARLGRVFINQIERGHNSVSLETIGAIAAALDEPAARLIASGTEPEPKAGGQPSETEDPHPLSAIGRRHAGTRG
jgi:transcriptional regulator with XRE-family HTH domain